VGGAVGGVREHRPAGPLGEEEVAEEEEEEEEQATGPRADPSGCGEGGPPPCGTRGSKLDGSRGSMRSPRF